MLRYIDLVRRLQNMTYGELCNPIVIETKGGLRVAKSFCKVEDYSEAERDKVAGLPPLLLVIDVIHDDCDVTGIIEEDSS